jgi:putative FmdB family regulatory protein
MPTYEYRCPEGHEFELMQRMSDRPRAKCPVCGRPATRQISGGAGLIFKGSGFYITDYGKDGKGPRQDKESEPKPPAPAADLSGSKAEPADKSDQGDKSEKPAAPAPAEKPKQASKSARKKSKP